MSPTIKEENIFKMPWKKREKRGQAKKSYLINAANYRDNLEKNLLLQW
jgi:hypothetical protein